MARAGRNRQPLPPRWISGITMTSTGSSYIVMSSCSATNAVVSASASSATATMVSLVGASSASRSSTSRGVPPSCAAHLSDAIFEHHQLVHCSLQNLLRCHLDVEHQAEFASERLPTKARVASRTLELAGQPLHVGVECSSRGFEWRLDLASKIWYIGDLPGDVVEQPERAAELADCGLDVDPRHVVQRGARDLELFGNLTQREPALRSRSGSERNRARAGGTARYLDSRQAGSRCIRRPPGYRRAGHAVAR